MRCFLRAIALTIAAGVACANAATILASLATTGASYALLPSTGSAGFVSHPDFSGRPATITDVDFLPNGRAYAEISSGDPIGGGPSINGLYAFDPFVGVATRITDDFPNGTFDYDPAVGQLRVKEGNRNLLVDPVTGAVTGEDQAFHYASDDPNTGVTPSIEFAHSPLNSALYAIDTVNFVLSIAVNPASGELRSIATLTRVPSPGNFPEFSVQGFDIGGDGTAYVALSAVTFTQIFTLNLTTALAAPFSSVPGPFQATDIAVAPIPEPGTWLLSGLGLLSVRLFQRIRR
jgi:hypothetical protein